MFIGGTQEKAGRTNRLVNSMKYFSCALLVVAGQTHTSDGEALLALQSLQHPGCSEEVKAWQQARYTLLIKASVLILTLAVELLKQDKYSLTQLATIYCLSIYVSSSHYS